MIRRIAGFHRDEAGDWVAELDCLHSQHVRHRPPFRERPWVQDPAGRRARIGTAIECPLCDRAELPAGLSLLRVAGPWDEETLPTGLRRIHRTAEGVWGVLRVTAGAAGIRIETTPTIERTVTAARSQAIPPATPHDVSVNAPVQLVVEFWGRREGPAPDAGEC
jgi:tellurite resistance-related uncharacterized protein